MGSSEFLSDGVEHRKPAPDKRQIHGDPGSRRGGWRCASSRKRLAKRVALPEWVKRAVLFRDRGMCAAYNTDVSGILTAQPDRNFDHIIPLAAHGINDVTNVQLL
jgi:hypothetical protein